jgi:hypothetical protein
MGLGKLQQEIGKPGNTKFFPFFAPHHLLQYHDFSSSFHHSLLRNMTQLLIA